MNKKEKEATVEEAVELIDGLIKKGYTNYRIAKETTITDRTIGNYVNKATRPSFANAKILIKTYKSKDGELKESNASQSVYGNNNNVGHNNTIGSNNVASEPSVYYAINQDQIKLMELEIESLKKQLEDKDRIIAAKDQTLKLYEKMIEKQ